MDWARVLAYVTGTVDQELLARNEYLAAENRILKAQLKGRLARTSTRPSSPMPLLSGCACSCRRWASPPPSRAVSSPKKPKIEPADEDVRIGA